MMTWYEYADLWLKYYFGEPRDLDKYEAAKYVAAIHEWNEADSDKRRQLETEVGDERND